MLLQHSFKLRRTGGLMRHLSHVLLCVLILSGCATGPMPTKSRMPNVQQLHNVPPKALTLFEQAAAAMAAGDTIDAELRFKEFVLWYPDYPGAYVNLAIISAQSSNDKAAEGFITDALNIDPDSSAVLSGR